MFKTKNAINLSVAFMMLSGLVACSSSDEPVIEPNPVNPVQGLGLTENSITGRVINLVSGSNAAKTRTVSADAPTVDLTMPEVPDNRDAADINARTKKLTGKSQVPRSAAPITLATLDLNNQVLIVKGELTLNGYTGKGTIFVDGPKAKLTLGENVKELKGVTLVLRNSTQAFNEKAQPGVVVKSNELTIDADAALYAYTFVNLPSLKLVNNGNIYVGSNGDDKFLHVASATFGEGSNTKIGRNLNVEGKLDIKGKVEIGKTVWADNLTVEGKGVLVNKEKINAYNGMTVTGQDARVYASYLKVGGMNGQGKIGKVSGEKNTVDVATLTQADGSQIILGNNGFVEVYNYENKDNGGAFLDCDAADGLAILHAHNLRWNNDADPDFLHTSGAKATFGVQFDHAFKNGSTTDLTAKTEDNIDGWDLVGFDGGNTKKIKYETEFSDMTIPADAAVAFNGYNPDKKGTSSEATKFYLLKPTAEVTYGEGEDATGLSATCVQLDGQYAYVSYHTRGNAQGGRLEVMSTTTDGHANLIQSVSASDAKNKIDWNHILIDKTNKRLIGVGNCLKGGVLTSVDLIDNKFNTTDKVVEESTLKPLQYVVLRAQGDAKNDKADGNAVILNGGDYNVASGYGVELFNTSLQGDGTLRYGGNGKHIATNGNIVVTAAFASDVDNSTDETAKTPTDMVIRTYNAGDVSAFDGGNATSETTIKGVWPTNGKNTVAIDADGTIYVCAGALGLKVIKNGTISTYQPKNAFYTAKKDGEDKIAAGTKVYRGYCNGVCLKGDKVYLAYGSLGVIVLNKNDINAGKELATYAAGRSANFVNVDDNDNIYVAYGQNRLKVLKLQENKR